MHEVSVVRGSADREFDAGLWGTGIGFERYAAGQTVYRIDVEVLLSDYLCGFGNLTGGQFAAEQCDDMSVFALLADPVGILFFRDWLETYVDAQLVTLEQQLLHDFARTVGGGFEEDAQRQALMDVGLSNVENIGIVTCQYIGE